MSLRKVLIATDFSEHARAAVRRAASFGAAEIVVVHAFDPGGGTPDAVAEGRNALQLAVDGVVGELVREGRTARGLLLEGRPEEQLAEAARSEACDLLVVGAQGRTGLRRLLLGSVAEKVVRLCEVPVLIARGAGDKPFARILAATDFEDHATRALDLAIQLAAPVASVEVVHFVQLATYAVDAPGALPAPTVTGELEKELARRGAALVEPRRREGLTVTFARDFGGARDGILDRLESGGHDLVAVGTHGRRGMTRFLLGSVAEAIARHAPCSVLVSR